MESDYFWRLAERCASAARHCFDLSAIEEFRALADEFAGRAVALESINATKDCDHANENVLGGSPQ
jgi:hypothetical protein